MPRSRTTQALAMGLLGRKYLDDLEDAIVDRMHVESRSDKARAELVRQTGITDGRLLDELADLGFTAQRLIALRLIPLVLVAWADNHVDARERKAVLRVAETLGIREDSDAYIMLDHWLHEMPPGESVDAWKRYMQCVMGKMSGTARRKLVHLFKKQMVVVAKASGGHLGIGRISLKERQMIHGLLNTLEPETISM